MKSFKRNRYNYLKLFNPYFRMLKCRVITNAYELKQDSLVKLVDTEYYFLSKSKIIQKKMAKTLHKIVTGNNEKASVKLKKQSIAFDQLHDEHEQFNKTLLETVSLN